MDPEDAKRRIVEAFGDDFVDPGVVAFGGGLDNAAFLVDGEWVFRFPRDAERAWYLRRELEVLPRLPDIGVPVPRPRFVDPAPFAGYRLLEGTPASQAAAVDRVRVARRLGEVLRRLHSATIEGLDAPPPKIGKTDPSIALPRIPARYRALAESLLVEDAPRARWVHGDLYPRHLLLDDAGDLAGIIDWGDVHQGDPAVDLSLVHGWLDADARAAFEDAYGPIDERTATRARFVALYYGVVLAPLAESLRAPDLAALSAEYLSRVAGA